MVAQAIEIIKLKVASENVEQFISTRHIANKAVSALTGFVSSELCQLNDEDWVLFIRWENMQVVREAQKITENMQEISDWVATAKSFISFDTAEVKNLFSKQAE